RPRLKGAVAGRGTRRPGRRGGRRSGRRSRRLRPAHRADHAAGEHQDGFHPDRGARNPGSRIRPAVSSESCRTGLPACPSGAKGPARMTEAVGVDGVWKFYGDYPALRNVSLSAAPGACLALIGRNGAGKTTLLRTIAGFSRPGKGKIAIFGNGPRDT